MRMRPLVLLSLLPASGCGADPLGPEIVAELTHFGGCADVIFFAVDADDEVMVTFHADGLVAAAQQSDTETTTVVDLPSDDVHLVIEQGSKVSDATCDDVVENLGPRVRRRWVAVSGTATVRIHPLEGVSGGRGDLVLEDVVFASGGEATFTLERLEWQDVSVGWFPG